MFKPHDLVKVDTSVKNCFVYGAGTGDNTRCSSANKTKRQTGKTMRIDHLYNAIPIWSVSVYIN